jgi:ABC-type uncharacterized transport system substrate-binding protein
MARTTRTTTQQQLEALRRRIDLLDAEVAKLKHEARTNRSQGPKKWWEEIAGHFDGDPVFDEIVKEGRKWRRSQRPSKGAGRVRT